MYFLNLGFRPRHPSQIGREQQGVMNGEERGVISDEHVWQNDMSDGAVSDDCGLSRVGTRWQNRSNLEEERDCKRSQRTIRGSPMGGERCDSSRSTSTSASQQTAPTPNGPCSVHTPTIIQMEP